MRAIFRICGNENQPGLQGVEKLATPLPGVESSFSVSPFLLLFCYSYTVFVVIVTVISLLSDSQKISTSILKGRSLNCKL